MKVMACLVLAILIIFGLRLFWSSTDVEVNNTPQNEVLNDNKNKQVESTASETDSSLLELPVSSDEEKTRLMTVEYEILKQARKKLKRHIAQLKHDMWGLKFPSDTARKISTTGLSASRLLKNPHMLGAFSSVEGIKDEIAKVNFAEKSLEQVDEIIKASENEKSKDNSA